MTTISNSPPKITAAIAMATVVLGAFLPWASFLGYSVSGIEGDGAVTLGAAVIGLAILFFAPRRTRKVQLWISGLLAAAVAFIALVDMSNFAAIGIYLTLIGGLVWFAAVIWDARSPVQPVAAAGSGPRASDIAPAEDPRRRADEILAGARSSRGEENEGPPA